MQNPPRKFIAVAATTALMLGGSVAFGVSGFAADGPTTPTTPTSSTSSTTSTTAPPTTTPAPPTTIIVPMTLDPLIVAAGGTTHLVLPNIAKNATVEIGLVKGAPKNPDVIPLTTAKTDANGVLDVTLAIPADTVPGTYAVVVHPEGGALVYEKAIEITAKVQTPAAQSPAEKPVSATPKFTG